MRKYLLSCSCLENPFPSQIFEHSIITGYRLTWGSTAAPSIENCSLSSLPSITNWCPLITCCASEMFTWWLRKNPVYVPRSGCNVPCSVDISWHCLSGWQPRERAADVTKGYNFEGKNDNVLVSHYHTNWTCKFLQTTKFRKQYFCCSISWTCCD